jgi:hypothetical protein
MRNATGDVKHVLPVRQSPVDVYLVSVFIVVAEEDGNHLEVVFLAGEGEGRAVPRKIFEGLDTVVEDSGNLVVIAAANRGV